MKIENEYFKKVLSRCKTKKIQKKTKLIKEPLYISYSGLDIKLGREKNEK